MPTGRNVLAGAAMLLAGWQGALAQTAPDPTAPVALPTPVMSGPLALSAVPPSLTLGPLGTWYVDGIVSGLGLVQGNAMRGDHSGLADVSNGQLFIQKTAGLLRFYLQVGAYALPALGQRYLQAADTSDALNKQFGAVPTAFVKVAPSEAFSVQLGKLPSLIGGEYTFTFENLNIERGLLWSQEPAISRGIQANYTLDPLAFSVSLNDGFYAGRYNWLDGSVSWNVNAANVLVFVAGANLGTTATNTLATPVAQNNSSIFNLLHTYTHGPLMLMPYLQYTAVAPQPSIGIPQRAASYGAALLASYAFTKTFTLGARIEVEATSGERSGPATTNLLYGPGSRAASFTLTPTYTIDRWFVRGEASEVGIAARASGDGFGRDGNANFQFRALLEVGYLF